ncbi:hypothetical protein OSTOST_03931 [Ostertagia ostertagi]
MELFDFYISVYGWAECGIGFMSSMKQRYQSTATILPSFQQKVVSLKNGKAAGFMEEGEICLRSPTIMKGYLNNAEETAKVVDSEGWFHTGDIGLLEHNGQTTFIEHIEEPMHVNGRLVVPSELERVLKSHMDILDAAIIGVADNNTGEKPRAFVVSSNPHLSESDVKKFIYGTTHPVLSNEETDHSPSHEELSGGVECCVRRSHSENSVWEDFTSFTSQQIQKSSEWIVYSLDGRQSNVPHCFKQLTNN